MQPIHLLAVIAINALFGGAYALGKVGVDHFPPYLFVTLRSLCVALALLPFLRLKPVAPRQWPYLVLFGLTMGVVVFAAMYQALALTETVSPIVIGTQLSVPFAVLLGILFLREPVRLGVLGAIALAFAGVVVIAFDATVLESLPALGWCTVMALAYGAASVLSRGLKSLDARVMNAWMAVISVPVMLGLSLAFEADHAHYLTSADWVDWAMVLYAGLGVSVLGHVSMFALMKRYPVAMIMPFYVLTPIFGVLYSILLFGESPTLQIAVGAALVLAAILYINRQGQTLRRYRKRQPA